jgi:hypothetical protein
MFIVGLSDVMGSCGMKAISLPRTFCISSSESDARSFPSARLIRRSRGRCSASSLMMDSPMVVLPQPDSPTRPTHSPFADLERHVVDGHDIRGSHSKFSA